MIIVRGKPFFARGRYVVKNLIIRLSPPQTKTLSRQEPTYPFRPWSYTPRVNKSFSNFVSPFLKNNKAIR